MSGSAVTRKLRSLADPARALHLQRFFKTGPGQYGEGDRFLGVTVPQIRSVAGAFRDLSLREIEALLESPWHEARLLAAILMAGRYRRVSESERLGTYRLYLRRTDRINNWDLVDVSAPQVVGAHLEFRSRAPLYRLAKSKALWDRRVAIVATFHFIRGGDLEDTLDIARILMNDKQDLIHKATGWMLREVGKKDEHVLRRFLDRHAGELPRTTLRYAIERLSPTRRATYMRKDRIHV